MKKISLILVLCLAIISSAYSNHTDVRAKDNKKFHIVSQSVDGSSNEVVDAQNEKVGNVINAAPAEKKSRTKLYIIIGVAAVVVYAVYRKKRKITKRKRIVVSSDPESVPRVIHHKELTLDYLMSKDAKEFISVGATSMGLFKFDTFVAQKPNGRELIKGFDNLDESKIVVCVGIDDGCNELGVVLHHAEDLDEQLSNMLVKDGVLEINFYKDSAK